jgi:hypothetical protein
MAKDGIQRRDYVRKGHSSGSQSSRDVAAGDVDMLPKALYIFSVKL